MNYLFSSCHQYMHCSVIRPRPEKKSVVIILYLLFSSQSGQLYMQQQAFCVTSIFLSHVIVSILLNLGTSPCLVIIFFHT